MGLFDAILRRHEDARHRAILSSAAEDRPARPAEPGVDGFLWPKDAAQVMGVTLGELAIMVSRGQLESRSYGGGLRVRPAVVSVLKVGGG